MIKRNNPCCVLPTSPIFCLTFIFFKRNSMLITCEEEIFFSAALYRLCLKKAVQVAAGERLKIPCPRCRNPSPPPLYKFSILPSSVKRPQKCLRQKKKFYSKIVDKSFFNDFICLKRSYGNHMWSYLWNAASIFSRTYLSFDIFLYLNNENCWDCKDVIIFRS